MSLYSYINTRDVGRTREKVQNHEPEASPRAHHADPLRLLVEPQQPFQLHVGLVVLRCISVGRHIGDGVDRLSTVNLWCKPSCSVMGDFSTSSTIIMGRYCGNVTCMLKNANKKGMHHSSQAVHQIVRIMPLLFATLYKWKHFGETQSYLATQ